MAAQRNAERVADGRELEKEGDKLLKGGWFSQSDPSQAERKYQAACKKYRVVPPTEESLSCLVNMLDKLGHLQIKLNYYNDGAKSLDEAARALERAETDPAKSVSLWVDAAESYRLSGQHDRCCQMLLKSASLSEGQQKVDLAHQACDVLIEEERSATCRDYFRQAIDICLKQGLPSDAIDLLHKQIELLNLKRQAMAPLISQSQLGVIVIHLYEKEREIAQEKMQQFCLEGDFGSTDKCQFAARLVKAAVECDEEQLQGLLPDFGIYLVGECSRLGRKMNFNGLEPINMMDRKMDDENEAPDLDVDLGDGDDGPSFM